MVARTATARTPPARDISARLLAWYDRHHRELPWRTTPAEAVRGLRPDPYHVWLSEVMLQQTTVEAAKPYFRKFLEKWPDAAALAAAPEDDILKAWAGLGYYSRARNLKKCADAVAIRHGGVMPDTEEALRALPGIGEYTAAAIAAIAFDRPAAVVDGNVERVTARLFAIEEPLPEAKKVIRPLVAQMLPAERPGDFAQATMDLGATICTPRRPSCMLCPVSDHCAALAEGDPETFPRRGARAEKPVRRGAAYVALRGGRDILLRRRPDKGLLAAMTEVPTSAWSARADGDRTVSGAPFPGQWRPAGTVSHVFTHFALELEVFRLDVVQAATPTGHRWAPLADLHDEALPTVMKKAIEAAIPGATRRMPHSTEGKHA